MVSKYLRINQIYFKIALTICFIFFSSDGLKNVNNFISGFHILETEEITNLMIVWI